MKNSGVGRIEGIADFPLDDELSNSPPFGLFANGFALLGPPNQALKTDAIAVSDHHVHHFPFGNGSPYGLGTNPKKTGSFGNRYANDGINGSHI